MTVWWKHKKNLTVEARAAVNVRGDTVVVYCVRNAGRVGMIARDITCRDPKSEVLFGQPMPLDSIEAYAAWLAETKWKTVGDDRPRPFVTQAGSTICTFIVVPGRHGELDLSMAFDPVDGSRRITTRVRAVDIRQQEMGVTI